jgi:hypothetical protein
MNGTATDGRAVIALIDLVVDCIRAASDVLDNSEELLDGSFQVGRDDALRLAKVLDDLEGLPPEPGYAAGAANNAQYALTCLTAPRHSAVQDQADAWFAVCGALSVIKPGWQRRRGKSAMDAAVLAIKELGARIEPDEALIQRISDKAFRRWHDGEFNQVEATEWAIRQYISLNMRKEQT